MGDVVAFKRPAKPRKGMCRHGFHKWVVCKKNKFDVKQGRLVTVYRCARCGKTKTVAH